MADLITSQNKYLTNLTSIVFAPNGTLFNLFYICMETKYIVLSFLFSSN